MMSHMKLPSVRRRTQESPGLAWRPMSAWSWTLSAAAAVVIVALVVTVWLLAIAGHAKPGTDQANAKLDAVRTGLAAGAGAGAAVGLMLAFRRQHHQEIATTLTDRDATERRITELYTKAVEQLGSDKAPVRLGGLYALERVAQDNPAQRQTIVNVFCACLRMPFAPEAPELHPGQRDDLYNAWQQEKQVRQTAQRILANHLRIDWFQGEPAPGPAGPEFWPDMRLDLTGAILIDLNFLRVVTAEAQFAGATFIGTAQFYEASIGSTSFHEARFTEDAAFSRASFRGPADFTKAAFEGKSWFSGTAFDRDADFSDAGFTGAATFYGTHFHEMAEFQPATFSDDAMFANSIFEGSAWFSSSAFEGRASFGGAEFKGDVTFQAVTFGGATDFAGATFSYDQDRPLFVNTRVLVESTKHAWPTGWEALANRRGEYVLARDKAAAAQSS
jgi:uncharacterized protein YjbI with pentapeptide repeats